MLLGTLGASLLGNLLSRKGIYRTGYGNSGKGMYRTGYGNSEKLYYRTGYGLRKKSLMPPHPLTNIEIRKLRIEID